jgi:hypothetical protein
MRALVVFESAFGNTEKIARAINEGLTSVVPTRAVEVGGAALELEGDVDLLVVGGPTHAFGMSRPGTRQQAAKQAEHGWCRTGSESANGSRASWARLPDSPPHSTLASRSHA